MSDFHENTIDLSPPELCLSTQNVNFIVKGIIAPVFTPTNEDGQLNLSVIPAYAKHLHEHDVDGVLIGGTSGESMCLSVEERKMLLEAWIREAKPLGLTVMTQVGGTVLPDVLTLAKHAESVGADGMLCLPELYFKPKTAAQLTEYLLEVSNAAPELPIVYYHFPAMTGVDMNMTELYQELISKVANFKGFKADLNVAVQLDDILLPEHKIFIANHFLAPSAALGYTSSIATVNNLFPSLVRDIIDGAKKNPSGLIRSQSKLNTLVAAITQEGKCDFVPSMKFAMGVITGIPMGPPRKPLRQLNSNQVYKIQCSLENRAK